MCMGGKKSAAPITHNHYTEPPAEEPTNTEPTSDLTDPNQQQKVAAISTTTSGTTNSTFGSELGA